MINQDKYEDTIIQILRRIKRLETGAKPAVGISGRGSTGALVVGAGADLTGLAVTLSWVDTNVLVNPGAMAYVEVYVDNDNNPAYQWPSGVSLSSGQKNLQFDQFMDGAFLASDPNKSRWRAYLKNLDSGSHTYYIYITFVYNTGGSGVQ